MEILLPNPSVKSLGFRKMAQGLLLPWMMISIQERLVLRFWCDSRDEQDASELEG